MELTELLKFGMPVLITGILVMLERINAKVSDIKEDIGEIKNGMIWQDTCGARHDEINRRFLRLEKENESEIIKKEIVI